MKTKTLLISLAALFTFLSSCSMQFESPEHPLQSEKTQREPFQTGIASFYGPEFSGNKTASGESYNPNQLTAAHKTLPFGTNVEVKNVQNGKSVIVKINDRGPYIKGRVIDLSKAAAEQLGIVSGGVTKVALFVDTDSSSR